MVLAHALIGVARLRQRLGRAQAREELVRSHTPGRSFVDVGCMWGVDGAIAFAAEAAGASAVSGLDLMAPTPAFETERRRLGSAVRFVQGDLHDPATVAALGRHDVVWCSGVIYHAPHPMLTLASLRALTGELLILASETLPEVPGLRGACVFLPGLDARARRVHAGARRGEQVGLTAPFVTDGGYANWWWALSPSALCAMVAAAGFEMVECHRRPLHTTIVARAR